MGVIKFIITLPFRLLALAIIIPIKTVLGLMRFSAKAAFVTTRTALRSSLIAFAAGIGLGWFFTSTPTGRQLVDQIRDLMGQPSGPVDDSQLASHVRTELASNTHTWHLPQPEVSVSEGAVTLTGSVPHDTARADLEKVASAVRGVVSVSNSVAVEAPAATASTAVSDKAVGDKAVSDTAVSDTAVSDEGTLDDVVVDAVADEVADEVSA